MAERTFFGKIVKWVFIGFNVLMLFWLIGGVGGGAEVMEGATSEAERAGAAVGTGIGAFLIILIWALGDVILGMMYLFTRPEK